MTIPIIYAHPNTGGHCAEILKQVKKRLDRMKLNYTVVDLYKLKYDPVLHEAEHYTAGERKVTAENKKYQKMISDCENMIFIYPVWWGTMPAILKGWIDRVFVSGFAFRYEDGKPVAMLKGRKAILFLTSGGPSWFYTMLCSVPKRVMTFYTLRFCGIKAKAYQLGKSTRLDAERKGKIMKMVDKALVRLEE